MFERSIEPDDIRWILVNGEVIEEYPSDTPFPSRLLVGKSRDRVLHVVAADDPMGDETYIITVYEPDPNRWDADFRRRR